MERKALIKKLNEESRYKEIWLTHSSGSSMCALINEKTGWLMYLRYEGDTGFSSRNLNETSAKEIEFVLDNGQEDLYPKSWTYPLSDLKEALISFINNGELPSQIKWHDDFK